MRKRYQKVDRGLGITQPHNDAKKEAYDRYRQDLYNKERREKTYEHQDIYEEQKPPPQQQHQPVSIDLSNADIPPQIKSIMAFMLAPRQQTTQQAKQQANNQKLIKLMAFACAFMIGINVMLGGGIDVGRTAKDAFNLVFIFGIIAVVLIPVTLITMRLEAVMSKDNAARVGAAIIIGLVLLFLYWLASNWGGGYY